MIPYQKQVGQLLDPTMYQQSRRHSYHKTSSFTPQSSSLSMNQIQMNMTQRQTSPMTIQYPYQVNTPIQQFNQNSSRISVQHPQSFSSCLRQLDKNFGSMKNINQNSCSPPNQIVQVNSIQPKQISLSTRNIQSKENNNVHVFSQPQTQIKLLSRHDSSSQLIGNLQSNGKSPLFQSSSQISFHPSVQYQLPQPSIPQSHIISPNSQFKLFIPQGPPQNQYQTQQVFMNRSGHSTSLHNKSSSINLKQVPNPPISARNSHTPNNIKDSKMQAQCNELRSILLHPKNTTGQQQHSQQAFVIQNNQQKNNQISYTMLNRQQPHVPQFIQANHHQPKFLQMKKESFDTNSQLSCLSNEININPQHQNFMNQLQKQSSFNEFKGQQTTTENSNISAVIIQHNQENQIQKLPVELNKNMVHIPEIEQTKHSQPLNKQTYDSHKQICNEEKEQSEVDQQNNSQSTITIIDQTSYSQSNALLFTLNNEIQITPRKENSNQPIQNQIQAEDFASFIPSKQSQIQNALNLVLKQQSPPFIPYSDEKILKHKSENIVVTQDYQSPTHLSNNQKQEVSIEQLEEEAKQIEINMNPELYLSPKGIENNLKGKGKKLKTLQQSIQNKICNVLPQLKEQELKQISHTIYDSVFGLLREKYNIEVSNFSDSQLSLQKEDNKNVFIDKTNFQQIEANKGNLKSSSTKQAANPQIQEFKPRKSNENIQVENIKWIQRDQKQRMKESRAEMKRQKARSQSSTALIKKGCLSPIQEMESQIAEQIQGRLTSEKRLTEQNVRSEKNQFICSGWNDFVEQQIRSTIGENPSLKVSEKIQSIQEEEENMKNANNNHHQIPETQELLSERERILCMNYAVPGRQQPKFNLEIQHDSIINNQSQFNGTHPMTPFSGMLSSISSLNHQNIFSEIQLQDNTVQDMLSDLQSQSQPIKLVPKQYPQTSLFKNLICNYDINTGRKSTSKSKQQSKKDIISKEGNSQKKKISDHTNASRDISNRWNEKKGKENYASEYVRKNSKDRKKQELQINRIRSTLINNFNKASKSHLNGIQQVIDNLQQ